MYLFLPLTHRLIPTSEKSAKNRIDNNKSFLTHQLNFKKFNSLKSIEMGSFLRRLRITNYINNFHNCWVELPFHVALSSLLSSALASAKR